MLPIPRLGLPYQCLISCLMLLFSGWNKNYPLQFQAWAVGSSPLRLLERRWSWQTCRCESFLKYLARHVFENQEGKMCWEPGRENPAAAGATVAALGPRGAQKWASFLQDCCQHSPSGAVTDTRSNGTGFIWYRAAEFNYGQESNGYS